MRKQAVAGRHDFAAIDEALKRGARNRRAMTVRQALGLPSLASVISLIWPVIFIIGAVLTFAVPDPGGIRRYARDDVLAQIAARRGEVIGSTPYVLVHADPFTHGHVVTISDGYYQATSSVDGSFVLRDGVIYPAEGGRIRLFGLEETGKRQAFSIPLPSLVENMIGGTLAEGRGVNIKAAATDRIADIPVFRIPPADRALFAENEVESVEKTPQGFVVTYSDGTTKADVLHVVVMLVGLGGTMRRFL